MTSKAGQKCTAIRRVIVPRHMEAAVCDTMVERLRAVVVGDPADATVTMGPLVSSSQRHMVETGIDSLSSKSEVVFRGNQGDVVAADAVRGAFVGPVLLRASADFALPHQLEVFGPVATVISYSEADEAFGLAREGGGSLTASVFSADEAFLANAVVQLGASHGRLLLVDSSIVNSHTGHGIVMPSCTHGGPGRAGGGEELGGWRGLWLYHQRTAIQASKPLVAHLQRSSVNPASST